MLKLDRLLSIVLMLHSKRLLRATDLSAHFGVSLRTIYRDINTLCEAGVPIAAEAGVGYSLVKGYSLPPVMFSNEEATALLIATEFLKKMSPNIDLRNHSASAVAKITSILPDDLKERIHDLQNTTAVLSSRAADPQHIAVPTVFSDLQRAIAERRLVQVQYISAQEKQSSRSIEPLGMVYYGNSWHCIAYCRLRQDMRDFRSDRIAALEISDERFNARPGFNILEFLREQYSSESPITVRVLFERSTARYVSNRHYYGFVSEVKREEGVEMTFLSPSLHYIGRWLFSFADRVEILEPAELKDIFRRFAQGVLNKLNEELLEESTKSS